MCSLAESINLRFSFLELSLIEIKISVLKYQAKKGQKRPICKRTVFLFASGSSPYTRAWTAELGWRVTMFPSCYGNIKPMNRPPPRDREVSKCDIDSVVPRNMLKPNLSNNISGRKNCIFNYIHMMNMILNIYFG